MKTPIAVAAGAVGLAAIVAIIRVPHAPASGSAGLLAQTTQTHAARDQAAPARVVVYVAGEVTKPGVYSLPGASRIETALRAAGGATRLADLLAVNLAEPLTDGEKVLVPARGAVNAFADALSPAAAPPRSRRAGRRSYSGSMYAAGSSGSPRGRRGRHRKLPPATPVDLNAADALALETLPGIGPSLAERIVAFRQLNGPFHNVDELLDVAGMTDRRIDEISAYLVIH